jgi:hypothetical protein
MSARDVRLEGEGVVTEGLAGRDITYNVAGLCTITVIG